MKNLSLGLSVFFAMCALIISAMFYFPKGGGFLIGLGRDLALITLAIGNLICFILNLLAYWQGFRRLWFGGILLIQTGFVVLFLGQITNNYIEQYRGTVTAQQLDAVYLAIKHDNLQAFIIAKNICNQNCQKSANRLELLYASMDKAYNIATWIVQHNGKVLTYPSRDMKTCEDISLINLGALEIAVANNDQKMLAILLPAANAEARYRALKLSVMLNNLEMLQWLVKQGISLDSPFYKSDEGKGLLIAAAENAAIDTALWLVNTQYVVIDDELKGTNHETSPLLSALRRYMAETDAVEAKPFLVFLHQNGINLEETYSNKTILQESIRLKRLNTVLLLLETGAKTQYLSDNELKSLSILLTQPPQKTRYALQVNGCVKVSRNLP